MKRNEGSMDQDERKWNGGSLEMKKEEWSKIGDERKRNGGSMEMKGRGMKEIWR